MSFLACCASKAVAASVKGYVEVMSGFRSTIFRERRLMASAKHPGVYLTVPISNKKSAFPRSHTLKPRELQTFNAKLFIGDHEKGERCQWLAQASLNICKIHKPYSQRSRSFRFTYMSRPASACRRPFVRKSRLRSLQRRHQSHSQHHNR